MKILFRTTLFILSFILYDLQRTATAQGENGATTPIPTRPPYHVRGKYTISCLKDGSVSVKGLGTNGLLTLKGTGAECTKTLKPQKGVINIDKACVDTLSVTFTVEDTDFYGGFSTKPVPDSHVQGGQNKHTMTVSCNPIPDGGVKVYVMNGVGVVDTATIKVPIEIDQVEMRIKSEKYTDLTSIKDMPDVSSVYIGDKFYMYLVYMGDDNHPYKVIPTKCTAFNGAVAAEPVSTTKRLELWKTNSCVQNTALNYHLMHTFEGTGDNRAVYAEMFGFRFDGASQSSDVTFYCEAKLCKDVDTGCTLPTKGGACKTDWEKRRKRDARDTHVFKTSRQIQIKSRSADNSGSRIQMRFFSLLAVLTWIVCHS